MMLSLESVESFFALSAMLKGLSTWVYQESLAVLQPYLELTPSSTLSLFSHHHSHNVLDHLSTCSLAWLLIDSFKEPELLVPAFFSHFYPIIVLSTNTDFLCILKCLLAEHWCLLPEQAGLPSEKKSEALASIEATSWRKILGMVWCSL